MKRKFNTKEEAISYCFSQVKPSIIGLESYNKFRLTKARYEKGELKQKGIKTLFDFFGIKEHCTYEVEIKEKKKPTNKASSSKK